MTKTLTSALATALSTLALATPTATASTVTYDGYGDLGDGAATTVLADDGEAVAVMLSRSSWG